MRKAILFCAIATFMLIVAVPRAVLSWGGDGHRTVGAIADLLLEQHPTTRDRVKQILGDNSLSDVSVWADCAKGFTYCHAKPTPEENAYVSRNSDHHTYHYTDVPIQEKKYVAGTAGTKADDVVQVIGYAIKVLRGQAPSNGPAALSEREALWVLVHLVGDVHQPLHVGAVYYDKDCGNIVDPNVLAANEPNFWHWALCPRHDGRKRSDDQRVAEPSPLLGRECRHRRGALGGPQRESGPSGVCGGNRQ